MPNDLTPRLRAYLEFIRDYIAQNKSAPMLKEIAQNFNVKSSTANKALEALKEKGYLHFGRSKGTGFYIRLLERWKVVRRVFSRGDRKNYYEIAGDLGEIETEIMSTIVKDEIEKMQRLLERSSSDLKDMTGGDEEETKEIEFVRMRVTEMSEYIEAVEHLLRVVMQDGKVTAANIKKIDIS